MSSLPHSLFTTDGLPARDRFSGWREDMSVIFDVEPVPGHTVKRETFHATFELYHFGRSVLGGLSSSMARYVRSQRKAARDALDAILLQVFLEGGVQFGVGQRTTYAETGDIVVFDLAQPVDNTNRNFHHITSMWPRAALEEVVPNIAAWHGLTLPKESPGTALLRKHMISSFELASHFTVEQGHRVEDATLCLAGAAFAGVNPGEAAAETPAMKELLVYQIKRYIRQNLGLTDLSPDRIARKFGISRRQLYHFMEPVGGITRYQRRLRLQRCLSDLQNPEHARLTLSEIAYRWGFKHPATSNRSFRAAFGTTPGEARAGALVERTSSPFKNGDFGDKPKTHTATEHQQWFHAIGI